MNFLKIKMFLLSALIILISSKTVFALYVDTHKFINETIAEMVLPNEFSLLPSEFSLNEYLTDQLGLTEGIREVFDNKKISEWLGKGGIYEDLPISFYLRSINHFHDPISNMGYHYKTVSGYSIIEWALLPQQGQYFGYYSWNDVMDYYRKALTDEDPPTRNNFFALMFRGLGQLTHLVQDASAPPHTRNDQHPAYSYETWVYEEKDKISISNYVPIFFEGAMDSYSGSLYDSIASFIDTNQYVGLNPDDTASTEIGISEYSSANFFSMDTNAFESTNYPFPQVPDDLMSDPTNIEKKEYISLNGDNYPREYYKKNCCGETNGGNGYLLSAVDYLEYYRKSLTPLARRKLIVPLLDHNVYSDYADLLLPRAIGYSAGLLNYFFRGELEVIRVPNSNNIKIKNNSSEDMVGTFNLYYDAVDGNRYPVSGGLCCLSSLLPGETSNELSFTEPTDIAEGTQYTLVFDGILGSDFAVVGKVLPGCRFPSVATCSVPCSNFLLECQTDDWHKIGFLHNTNDPSDWEVYSWDFGDGEYFVGDSTDAISITHTYAEAGTYTVTCSVLDDVVTTYQNGTALSDGVYKTSLSYTSNEDSFSAYQAKAPLIGSYAEASYATSTYADWIVKKWRYTSEETNRRFDLTGIASNAMVELWVQHFSRFDSGYHIPNGQAYTFDMNTGMKNSLGSGVITEAGGGQVMEPASVMNPLIGTTVDIRFSDWKGNLIQPDVMPEVIGTQTGGNSHGWRISGSRSALQLKIRTPVTSKKTTKVIKISEFETRQIGDSIHEDL